MSAISDNYNIHIKKVKEIQQSSYYCYEHHKPDRKTEKAINIFNRKPYGGDYK